VLSVLSKEMERRKFFLLYGWIALLLAAGVGACSDHENGAGDSGEPVDIVLWPLISDEAASRVSGNDFETNDVIGVYAVPYEGEDMPGDIATSDFASNLPYEYTGYTWQQTSGDILRWPVSGYKVDFYGYYPYDSSLTGTDPTAYLFRVQMDQSDKTGYEQSDLLWASNPGVTPTRDPVPLGFTHLLSKVRVNIKSEIEITDAAWQEAVIYIVNAETEGRVDLSNGIVNTTTGNPGVIATTHLQTPEEGYSITSECIIFPQSIARGLTFIRIEFPSTGVRYSYQPVEAINFTQGKERPFNITITDTGLLVSVGNIADWQASDVIEGDIGKPLAKVVDLSGIDWQVNKIYGIYEDNYKVGEVVREYLYVQGTGTEAVSAQAVVVYIVNVDGEMDYSTGYVVQLMGSTRNTVLDIYEPADGDVHGGRVAWDLSANTIAAYTPGTSALPSKVSLSYNGVELEADNAIATLTWAPEVLSDYEGNTYPLVKIGTQVWTGTNWKSEYTLTGSPVTVYYFNDDEVVNKELYGGLYSWNTVMSNDFVPQGWKVPLLTEWTSLRDYLNNQCQKLKANILWNNLTYSDNMTGFTALPGGRRTDAGVYNELYLYGQWWTSTSSGGSDAQRVWLDYGNTSIHSGTLNRATWTQSLRLLKE